MLLNNSTLCLIRSPCYSNESSRDVLPHGMQMSKVVVSNNEISTLFIHYETFIAEQKPRNQQILCNLFI